MRSHGAHRAVCDYARPMVLKACWEDMHTACALLELAGGHSLNLEIMAFLHFRAGKKKP